MRFCSVPEMRRSVAARVYFLAQDRPDPQYASRRVSQHMSIPTTERSKPTLANPTLAIVIRPTLANPTLANPTLAKPTLAKPTLANVKVLVVCKDFGFFGVNCLGFFEINCSSFFCVF